MIREEANLMVADNSGAKRVRCIRVLGGHGKKYASVGDVIVVAVKSAIPNTPVKKGTVQKAVIVRTKKEIGRKDGSYKKLYEDCILSSRSFVIDFNKLVK